MSGQIRRENGITTVQVINVRKLDNIEAQHMLDAFIGTIEPPEQQNQNSILTAEEGDPGTKPYGLANSIIQQLNRISRELRGLPPLVRKRKLEAYEGASEGLVNENENDILMEDAAADQRGVSDGRIDKAERKRLKKERRKEEKRQKQFAHSNS
ncbi:hypothetical protein V1511DRAFT_268523 [Dipodascopsis uninucleata]